MDAGMAFFIGITMATTAWGLWMALFTRSYLQLAVTFPAVRFLVAGLAPTDDIESGSLRSRTQVVGYLVLGVAAGLIALLVHVLTT